MIYLFYVIVALIGASIHVWRHPNERQPDRILTTYLLWWLVLTIGVCGIVASGFHLFDGAKIAREIGFTRGDGGFQDEVAFGDLALGVAAVLCIWIRDRYWLAILIVASISLWGDAFGHLHQAAVNDNHDPDNTGLVLYSDFLFPAVGWLLYGARERVRRQHQPQKSEIGQKSA